MAETPQFYSPGVGGTSSVFHPKWKRPPQYQAFEPPSSPDHPEILFSWPTKKRWPTIAVEFHPPPHPDPFLFPR